MELSSMLPDWNPRIQSLSMKFLHGKVKAASSKNFLVSKATVMNEEHACLQCVAFRCFAPWLLAAASSSANECVNE